MLDSKGMHVFITRKESFILKTLHFCCLLHFLRKNWCVELIWNYNLCLEPNLNVDFDGMYVYGKYTTMKGWF